MIPEGDLEAVEHVPGALEVVLEAMSGQYSSRQALDIEYLEKHNENLRFFRLPHECLGGILERLGGSWGRLGGS